MNRLASVLVLLLPAALPADERELQEALLFYASFDRGVDADFARGDRRLWTASSYKDRTDAKPGLHHPDVSIAPDAGRFGAALQFRRKNTKALYYPAADNVYYRNGRWTGTVSFWLRLDPETDLEPGYCDPIQITAEAYNDAAIWVDFTKDEKPRHFRLGVFGDLKNWNPDNIPPEKNPKFLERLVVVRQPPFAREKWTHVVITHIGLGSGAGGSASLYLDGKLQGKTDFIPESFTWNLTRAAIRLGVNYVGLFDELAVFDRPLTPSQITELYQLRKGLR